MIAKYIQESAMLNKPPNKLILEIHNVIGCKVSNGCLITYKGLLPALLKLLSLELGWERNKAIMYIFVNY